jgi:hypothetical protein
MVANITHSEEKKEKVLTDIRNVMERCGVRAQKYDFCVSCSLYHGKSMYNHQASLEYSYVNSGNNSDGNVTIQGPDVRFGSSEPLQFSADMHINLPLQWVGKIYEKAQLVAGEVDKYLDSIAQKKKRSRLPNRALSKTWVI